VINKEGSDATNKPKQLVPLAHQISSKTCVNHSTISMLHSKYFPHPYRPCGGHPSKLSPADTHYVQELIGSWWAGNGAN